MTTKDKGELLVYINYLRAKGEESRIIARKPGLASSMSQWLLGCGNARLQIADELAQFIESADEELLEEVY